MDQEYLSWQAGKAKVRSFSTTSQKGATLVKVEIVVTDAWELGDLMRRLAELRDHATGEGK